jgi:arabinose-5-phosphate isomerase
MGDAIAVAASRQRGFTRDDFLRRHPAGQLGQQAIPVSAIMRTGGALPTVLPHMALAETVGIMTSGQMGAACVVDWESRLLGLIVDGDIRRVIQARGDLYSLTASTIMRANPITLASDATIGDALLLMRGRGPGLLVLPVTDDAGHLLGMVHSVDLVQAS